jgi:hypothetical protein
MQAGILDAVTERHNFEQRFVPFCPIHSGGKSLSRQAVDRNAESTYDE